MRVSKNITMHDKIDDKINIDIDSLKSFLSPQKNKERTRTHGQNKIKSSICLYDFSCINSILICNKIKEIKYYKERFANIIEKYESIKIGQLNEPKTRLEYMTPFEMKNNEKCLLLQYTTSKGIPFTDFLFQLPNTKLFIFHVLDSYFYLLNSCILLESQHICFFHLSSENIVFTENYKPVLCNFQNSNNNSNSLLLEKCNNENAESYLTQIIEKRKDFTHTPIEMRVLYFLIKNEKETLSMKEIQEISIHYTRSLSFLDFFSPDEKNKYYEECVCFLKQYVNMPKPDIIADILNYANSWDNFSLSILYLHIVQNIVEFYSLSNKSTFMNDFMILLIQNVSPNPMKRETLAKTHIRFETLYETHMDWTFIKTDVVCKNGCIQELYEKILK